MSKRYAEYFDPGAPWLSDVESLSGMTRLKYVSTVQTGVTLSGEGDPADPEWPYLRVANVQVGYVDMREIKTVRVPPDRAAASMLQPGDVLMTEGGDIDKLGRGALWRGLVPDMLHQNHIFAVRPSEALDSEFFVYWLDGSVARTYFRMTAKQTTNLAGTNKWTLGNLPVPVLHLEEQRAIADYLDRESARIDTLIEEQQRLIEMLDERRDAVIAEATTKGVSPGVALVESGVEWLGDIPEGWSVKALRRCGTLLTGGTPPTDDRGNFAEEANERPWVRPQDLSSETRASAWLTAEGWSLLRPVPAGSVLVGCIAYSLGSVGYLPVTATTNQQITSIVPAEDGRYLYYVMRAAQSELWAASQMNRVPILNNQRLGAIRVPVPPVEEQRLIAAYLDEQTEKIDRTKAEAKRFIELARERRAALITAAVTGQIDVREMV